MGALKRYHLFPLRRYLLKLPPLNPALKCFVFDLLQICICQNVDTSRYHQILSFGDNAAGDGNADRNGSERSPAPNLPHLLVGQDDHTGSSG